MPLDNAQNPQAGQIEGLPPGAIVTSIAPSTAAAAPTQASAAQQEPQIEGLPPGAIVSPITPESQPSGMLHTFGQIIAGPETAAGAPLSPSQQEEASGVSDIFQGDISKGLTSIMHAETPHVIAGSPIERLIQKFKPDFKGSLSPEQAEFQTRQNEAGLNAPLVDVAQTIDKQKHPILKALTEAAQSMTSPANVAIMIGTGGLGLVQSPKALAIANRLISAGFTANAIGQAYKGLKDFKEAYDNGDANEALYQLTHAVTSGTMAYLAGTHAAGVETPLVGAPEKAIASAVGQGAQAVGEAVGGAKQAVVSAAKKAVGIPETFYDAVNKISPASKGYAKEYAETLKKAEPQMREVMQKNPDVGTPQELFEAIDNHIKQNEAFIGSEAAKFKGKPEARMTGVESQVRSDLQKAFKENPGQYKPEEQEKAIQAVMQHLLQEEPGQLEGTVRLREPDLAEAEGIRQRFNSDTKPAFGSNAPAIDPAESFAKQVANKSLRAAIDQKFDDLGVKKVKEWRQQEAPLIDVRDQIGDAVKKSQEMGSYNTLGSFVKQFGWRIPVAMMAGMVGGGEAGVAAGLGGAGLGMAADYFRDLRSNPNRMTEVAARLAKEGGPSGAKLPEKQPVNPTEATGESVPGSLELEARQMVSETGKPFAEQKYPHIQRVRVEWPEHNDVLEDEIKGLNKGHALARAKENWPGAKITAIEPASIELEARRAGKQSEKPTTAEELAKVSYPYKLPTQPAMSIPASEIPSGYFSDDVHIHEHSHATVAAMEGFTPTEIRSYLHPELGPGQSATTRLTLSGIEKDPDGNLTKESMKQNVHKVLSTVMAGAAAGELFSGIPFEQNKGLHGDISTARKILQNLGYTPTEAQAAIRAGIDRAKMHLTQPGIADTMLSNARVREENLPETHHVSPERMSGYVSEIQRIQNENARTGRQAKTGQLERVGGGARPVSGEVGRETQPGREVGSPEGARPEVALASQEVTMPPEQTTGEHDEAIKAGGAVPGGIQEGDSEIGVPNLVLFHDPQTGSTLGLKEGKVTPEAVQKELAKSRAAFAAGEARKNWAEKAASDAKEQGGGFTINPRTGEAPKSGFMVEAAPENRTVLDHDVTAQDIRKFYQDNKQLFDEHPELHVGGYGKELSVSVNVPDQTAAEALAKKLDQISIWDVAKGEEVPTGGASKQTSFPDYPLTERMRDLRGGMDLATTKEEPTFTHKTFGVDDSIGRISALNADGEDIGHVTYNLPDPSKRKGDFKATIAMAAVDTPGQGLGQKLYLQTAERAKTAGARYLVSDTAHGVDPSAVRVWDKLIEKGYPVEKLGDKKYRMDLSKPLTGQLDLATTREPGEEDESAPSGTERVSVRVPTGKKSTENAMTGEPLKSDLDAVHNAPPELAEKLANIVKEYPGVKVGKNITDPKKVLDKFVGHVADNLRTLYKAVPEKMREANAKWYESANKIAGDIAEKHGLEKRQGAGVIAAMSPQMDWDNNVSLARRVTDIYHEKQDFQATPEMLQIAKDIYQKSVSPKNPQHLMKDLTDKIAGKKLSELTDSFEKAMWIRMYDETYNSPVFDKIDPATGKSLGPRTNLSGETANRAWANFGNIAKAINIMEDGSRQSIHDNLGKGHKVRSFYNNLIEPESSDDVTIDTHAVGASLLTPVAAIDAGPMHNFGGPGSNTTGTEGTYPLYAEAYRKVAAELGIKPRELQSVTWEKARNLFPEEFKMETNKKAVEKIWRQSESGKITSNQARQQIMKYAEDWQTEYKAGQAEKAAKQAEKLAERIRKGGAEPVTGKPNVFDFLRALTEAKQNVTAGQTALGAK